MCVCMCVQLFCTKFIRFLPQAVGVAVAHIDNVPLRLNSLILRVNSLFFTVVFLSVHLNFSICFNKKNVFCPQSELVSRIINHYTKEGVKEVYKVCCTVYGCNVCMYGDSFVFDCFCFTFIGFWLSRFLGQPSAALQSHQHR